ncbi:DUF1549 domain-containing protein, partial [Rhodopirellula bahusiensis]
MKSIVLSLSGLLIAGSLACPSLVSTAKAAAPAVPPQVAMINDSVEQVWRDFSIRPAAEADDATWCRRVYLDVIGRIPSFEELSEFMGDRDSNKR